MAVKVYFKRTLSLIIFVCFLTLVVFVSLNRPKEVKAAVIPAVALGVGALAVLVASYFSTAGVQLSQSGGEGTTYFEDFINDTVQQFKEDDQQSQAIFDKYFDSEGRYIGTEEDLQFILSPSARGYWSMGKDLVSGLESLKSWFVTENNLTVGSSTSLDSSTGFISNGIIYNICEDLGGGYFSLGSALFSQPIIDGSSFELINSQDISYSLTVDSHYYDSYWGRFTLYCTRVFNDVSSSIQFNIGGNASGVSANQNLYIVHRNNAYQLYTMSISNDRLYVGNYIEDFTNFVTGDVTSIGITGELTDGYDDFQDALNQDLANESENDDAVVVTGVGELGTDLTYDQIKELILQNVITGELNPTYEGTYENQEAAEEDLDKENSVVTPDWRPTPVIVNGLEDFFPFCIPFDLYAVIELLNAEPEAPKFTGHLDFANIFDSQDIELDFSQFDYLARIVRTIIVIAFLIFIILKTRDMIRG